MLELTSLGLSPSVLHSLLHPNDTSNASREKGKQRAIGERLEDSTDDETIAEPPRVGGRRSPQPKAVYELVQDGEHLEPRLRLWVGTTNEQTEEGEPGSIDSPPQSPSSRVAIFLDKPESAPATPTIEKSESDAFNPPNEDLLLISKPIASSPGQSLVWSLQKSWKDARAIDSANDQENDWSSLSMMSESDDTLSSAGHPVELVNKK